MVLSFTPVGGKDNDRTWVFGCAHISTGAHNVAHVRTLCAHATLGVPGGACADYSSGSVNSNAEA
eukprot:205051-Rhodomonas_salina.1